MPAVAVTDVCNFYGLVKMYKAAFAAGVQPIFGVDLNVMDADDPERAWPLCLLAMNQAGYRNLTRLISQAYTEGQQLAFPLCTSPGWQSLRRVSSRCRPGRPAKWGRPCCGVSPSLPGSCARSWMELYPGGSTWSCTAPGARAMRPICMRRWSWRSSCSARWWQPTMCASWTPLNSKRTRPGCVFARAQPG